MKVLRNLNDWDVYDYESLLGSLASLALVESDNQSIWTLNPNRSFSVGSFYKYLVKNAVEEKFAVK